VALRASLDAVAKTKYPCTTRTQNLVHGLVTKLTGNCLNNNHINQIYLVSFSQL